MWSEGSDLEIVVSKKKLVVNIIGISIGLAFFMIILTVSLTGFWMWFCDGLIVLLFLFFVGYYLHLPVIIIGKNGISAGEGKMYEWKRIERSYYFEFTTSGPKNRVTYHRIMIEFFDENGAKRETAIDITDYDFSSCEIEKAISYWSQGKLADSPEQMLQKSISKYPTLQLIREEAKRENKICEKLTIVLFCVLFMMVVLVLDCYLRGDRSYVTLIVCLLMGACMCVSFAFSSLVLMFIKKNFLSKHQISNLPKEERNALFNEAKKNKCNISNWSLSLVFSLLIAVVLTAIIVAIIKWGSF